MLRGTDIFYKPIGGTIVFWCDFNVSCSAVRFRWKFEDDDLAGWVLLAPWVSEEHMPHRGVMYLGIDIPSLFLNSLIF